MAGGGRIAKQKIKFWNWSVKIHLFVCNKQYAHSFCSDTLILAVNDERFLSVAKAASITLDVLTISKLNPLLCYPPLTAIIVFCF